MHDQHFYFQILTSVCPSSDKDSFVEKYGKDKIVKNMIIQKAQDIVMDNAVYK